MKFRIILTTITGLMLLGFTTYCGYMVFCHPESPRTHETPVNVVEPPQSGEVEVLGVQTDDRIKDINKKLETSEALTMDEFNYYIQKANEAIAEDEMILTGTDSIKTKLKKKMKDLYGKEKPNNTIGTEEINP